MSVAELIEFLQGIEDKTTPVCIPLDEDLCPYCELMTAEVIDGCVYNTNGYFENFVYLH